MEKIQDRTKEKIKKIRGKKMKEFTEAKEFKNLLPKGDIEKRLEEMDYKIAKSNQDLAGLTMFNVILELIINKHPEAFSFILKHSNEIKDTFKERIE